MDVYRIALMVGWNSAESSSYTWLSISVQDYLWQSLSHEGNASPKTFFFGLVYKITICHPLGPIGPSRGVVYIPISLSCMQKVEYPKKRCGTGFRNRYECEHARSKATSFEDNHENSAACQHGALGVWDHGLYLQPGCRFIESPLWAF